MEKIRIRNGNNSDAVSGMKKIRIRDGNNSDAVSGMKKIWIRDGKNLDPGWKKLGFGINIPDPQP
jgi:hypothetical protein